jgi:hypothetical protein
MQHRSPGAREWKMWTKCQHKTSIPGRVYGRRCFDTLGNFGQCGADDAMAALTAIFKYN